MNREENEDEKIIKMQKIEIKLCANTLYRV